MNRIFQVMIIEFRNLKGSLIAVFFSFIFPLIMMYFTVNSFTENAYLGDTYAIDQYITTALALGIAPLALLTFPACISKENELGVFLRYKLFHISMIMVILSKIILYVIIMIIQFILIMGFAKGIFELQFLEPERMLIFFGYYVLATIPMFLIGSIITILCVKNAVVQSVGMTIMFAFLIFSNAMMPVKNLPKVIEKAKYIIPTNDIVETLGGYWNNNILINSQYIIKYVIYTVICILILFLCFKAKNLGDSRYRPKKAVERVS